MHCFLFSETSRSLEIKRKTLLEESFTILSKLNFYFTNQTPWLLSLSTLQSLLAVLKSSRNHNSKANMSMAMCDAKTLYEAMESGISIDHMTMISLISQRNTEQIKSILISYKRLYGREFSKSLKRNICGQFGKELRIVIRCIQFPEKFFAKQIRMRNSDPKEILMRIIITRSKIDIKDINDVFATKTGGCLENVVRREFSNSKGEDNGIVADILVEMIKGFWRKFYVFELAKYIATYIWIWIKGWDLFLFDEDYMTCFLLTISLKWDWRE